ncbi:MAG TPA: signal recognition particle-docking protein FtsY [Phycisphaerae bacterium]|nr:signal recognition particle-docking protein FtsY [Phycisphaerae bacterium]HPS52500.1 signal recognition particle-docking protein FtsY [Phycisphaerae bacterium]
MALFRKAVDRLLKGLKRTKAGVLGTLRGLLAGRQIDAALLEELEMTLIQADIGVKSTMRIIDNLQTACKNGEIEQGEQVIEFLKSQLKQYWPAGDRAIKFAQNGPTVILVAGINGAGKTTSIAKLAYQFHSEGKKVLLAAADTFRAAAVEQLTIWADRIGCDIVKGSGKKDPAAVVYEACEQAIAHNLDILLVDTAGRLHTQENLMRELTKIRDVVAKKLPGAPHEVLLVLDATTGQNAINQARAFMKAIDATGIFLAKLDGTARGGIVVAIRDEINLPVKFVGVGEKFEDVELFDPEKFVNALFE